MSSDPERGGSNSRAMRLGVFGTGKTPVSFRKELSRLLEVLSWRPAKLAEATPGISEAQISGWLTSTRPIKREHVARVSIAIAQAMEKERDTKRSGGPGLAQLDGICNTLMAAAGYAPAHSELHNWAWNELQESQWSGLGMTRRELRVGFAPCPPFVDVDSSRPGEPAGLAADLVTMVCRLMRLRLDSRHYAWSDLVPALFSRQVDLLAPIMILLPFRMFRVRFSDSIGISVQGVAVCHPKFEPELKKGLAGVPPYEPENLEFHAAVGDFGEILADMFLGPKARRQPHADLPEGIAYVTHEPQTPKGRVRCFLSEASSAITVFKSRRVQPTIMQFPARLRERSGENSGNLKFPMAFAVHRDEPLLADAINSCLRVLNMTGYVGLLYDSYIAPDEDLARFTSLAQQ